MHRPAGIPATASLCIQPPKATPFDPGQGRFGLESDTAYFFLFYSSSRFSHLTERFPPLLSLFGTPNPSPRTYLFYPRSSTPWQSLSPSFNSSSSFPCTIGPDSHTDMSEYSTALIPQIRPKHQQTIRPQ
ncbi:hypothetical protein Hypma_004479 [Hypsizygus marmoreus]|uniref:Uncharacterized protein n=1 Tax=Hypsizygus marmoreus TaxID=39966 RepID=A0A369JY04_HYPMA|nr:hypothetical protein Hypma_004479 [Hypsizygus marmoreus]